MTKYFVKPANDRHYIADDLVLLPFDSLEAAEDGRSELIAKLDQPAGSCDDADIIIEDEHGNRYVLVWNGGDLDWSLVATAASLSRIKDYLKADAIHLCDYWATGPMGCYPYADDKVLFGIVMARYGAKWTTGGPFEDLVAAAFEPQVPAAFIRVAGGKTSGFLNLM
jgi:hypothetical protein